LATQDLNFITEAGHVAEIKQFHWQVSGIKQISVSE